MTGNYGIPRIEDLDRATIAFNGNAEPTALTVDLLSGVSVQPEPVRWLWRHWFALGKISLLAGAPGTGKSTLALSIAATVTIGGSMPDAEKVEAGDVLIWSGEDDIADTLMPRFLAAGGDQRRIFFVKNVTENGERRPFDPATDMPGLIEAARRRRELKLIILDPVVAAVSGDSHKNTEARRGLQPVADLAAETDSAVLGVTHFSKSTAGREPHERVNGSIAFAALPRVVLATIKPADPNAPRRLVRAKSNLGPDSGGVEYRLFQAPVPDRDFAAQRVEWGNVLEGTARELMQVEELDDRADAMKDAEAFLRELLADGPVKTSDVKKAADAHGHAWATVRRVKDVLGVVASKAGFKDGWTWQLPPSKAPDPPAEGARHD